MEHFCVNLAWPSAYLCFCSMIVWYNLAITHDGSIVRYLFIISSIVLFLCFAWKQFYESMEFCHPPMLLA